MGEKAFSGTQCDKTFSKPGGINEHEKDKNNPHNVKETRKSDTQFSCSACDRKFADLNALSKHEQDHTEKPFGCTKCNNKFTNQLIMNKHVKSHEGGQRNKLRIGSLNIGGGLISKRNKKGKEELLLKTLSSNQIDIACVQETELEHFDESRPFSINGFKTFFTKKRNDENDIKRLLIFVREGVEVVQRNDLMSPLVSKIWL